jgi:hypothetical protein
MLIDRKLRPCLSDDQPFGVAFRDSTTGGGGGWMPFFPTAHLAAPAWLGYPL